MALTTPSTITTSVQTTPIYAASSVLQEESRQSNSESDNTIDEGTLIGAVVGGIALLSATGIGIFIMMGRTICNRVSPLLSGRLVFLLIFFKHVNTFGIQ